ncbi:MAG: hypothetical protein A3C03_01760 [Candidatus Colwellbacteria bacterium RIFCSPHIGHO2_02_FULL_45_17]|uniref:Pyridoxamine 5'-phosphate oxidase N-terminal domain-containing protein n=1 Tax=Candidatus Colwellbacteria bacterium RIFCSPLOWO2_12_FULL_46_17 TaxID=1797695 RepID=A0A1G1ZDQ1_9BACT|nr:MAG: hypothetical protein A3C03_01760 [Candidatus Colwellbacteria bacterium RIFCSPHIGHO2_02_FULL_45_17]OGY62549.1 MAG: hypothetical protein A3G58_01780 [Candidatus Colwellbacteria bacterium RIFCSPLOWO2_12_FULL_46_17]
MKEKEYYISRVAEVLKKIFYASVATVTPEGKAWNSPVYFSFDEDLNFYWSSSPSSQHSKNIAKNSNVFLVVYDSNARSGEGEGVYIEAVADEVGADEFEHVIEVFGKRNGKSVKNISIYGEDGPQRLYRAVPRKMFINDDERDEGGSFVRDYRVELSIDDVKKALGEA